MLADFWVPNLGKHPFRNGGAILLITLLCRRPVQRYAAAGTMLGTLLSRHRIQSNSAAENAIYRRVTSGLATIQALRLYRFPRHLSAPVGNHGVALLSLRNKPAGGLMWLPLQWLGVAATSHPSHSVERVFIGSPPWSFDVPAALRTGLRERGVQIGIPELRRILPP